MSDINIKTALTNAVLTLDAIYQWVDKVEAAGGTTSLSGIAVCHAMLKSLKSNRSRFNDMILTPARAALKENSDE